MSGPIVRTGTTPKFWKNWDRVFGDPAATEKEAGAKKSAKKKPASASAAPKKTAAKSTKKKSAGKSPKK